jgi:hypothetical protein
VTDDPQPEVEMPAPTRAETPPENNQAGPATDQHHETTTLELSGIERVLITGDLSDLTPEQRIRYVAMVCQSTGLNPLTKPFEYMELDAPGGGKRLVLYAKRDATDQLRRLHNIDAEVTLREVTTDADGRMSYEIIARGKMPVILPNGKDHTRIDESLAVIPLCAENGEWKDSNTADPKNPGKKKRYFDRDGTWRSLTPTEAANAKMKCETKAKRRVTLSICGLGLLDETEIADVALSLAPNTIDITTSQDRRLRDEPNVLLEKLDQIQNSGLRVSRVLKAMGVLDLGDLPLDQIPALDQRIEDYKRNHAQTATTGGEKK